MDNMNTEKVLNEIDNKESLSEKLKYIELQDKNFSETSFFDFFNIFLSKHPELSLAKIIEFSGVDRKYAYKIISGKSIGSRDRIIALCLGAKMELDDINHALRYSGHNNLDTRSKRDVVIRSFIQTYTSKNASYKTITDLSILLDEQNQAPLDFLI